MFMKQATTDRLLGMLVTLATGAAIFYIQVSVSLRRWNVMMMMIDDDGREQAIRIRHTGTHTSALCKA